MQLSALFCSMSHDTARASALQMCAKAMAMAAETDGVMMPSCVLVASV
jgi:hypothetical protein